MPKIPLLIDRPDLIDHPFFCADDPRARIAASDAEFDALLNPYFSSHTKMEIAEKAQELRMATGPVQSTQDLLNCPQLKFREYFKEIEHPVVGKLAYPGMPFITGEDSFRRGRAPLLGEHNEEVYGRLGFTSSDLVKLRERGVI
jgi:formyl-CoA transferase